MKAKHIKRGFKRFGNKQHIIWAEYCSELGRQVELIWDETMRKSLLEWPQEMHESNQKSPMNKYIESEKG